MATLGGATIVLYKKLINVLSTKWRAKNSANSIRHFKRLGNQMQWPRFLSHPVLAHALRNI